MASYHQIVNIWALNSTVQKIEIYNFHEKQYFSFHINC